MTTGAECKGLAQVTCILESLALPGQMAASLVSSFRLSAHSFTDFSWEPSLINHAHTKPPQALVLREPNLKKHFF